MRFKDILLALIIAVLWGGNFIVVKIATNQYPPLFIMFLRLSLVSLLLLPYFFKKSLSPLKLTSLAFTQSVGHNGLLFTAVDLGLPISAIVITAQLNVPFSILLGTLFLKDSPSIKQIIGIVIAFSGILLIFGSPHIQDNILAFYMVVGGALSMAVFNVQFKKEGKFEIMPFTAWSSLIAAPQLLILSLLIEPISLSQIKDITPTTIATLFYMAASTIIGFGLWFYLLQKYSVNLVAPFSLLVPIFGILFASIFLNEKLTFDIMVGGIITIVGIGIVNIKFNNLCRRNAS